VVLIDPCGISRRSDEAQLVFRPRGFFAHSNRVRGQAPLSAKTRVSGGDPVIGITCEPMIPAGIFSLEDEHAVFD